MSQFYKMPKSDELLQAINGHLEKEVDDWMAPAEGDFAIARGPFDYDISDLDVDEKYPIARINVDDASGRGMQHPAVIRSDDKFNVRNPLKNRHPRNIRRII